MAMAGEQTNPDRDGDPMNAERSFVTWPANQNSPISIPSMEAALRNALRLGNVGEARPESKNGEIVTLSGPRTLTSVWLSESKVLRVSVRSDQPGRDVDTDLASRIAAQFCRLAKASRMEGATSGREATFWIPLP